jgi:hypothetical protein
MKKVKLEPEQLAVESFRTAEPDGRREQGTVHGQARCTYYYNCLAETGRYWCGTEPSFSCDYTGAWCEP